jgi:hypothetical protein
LGIHFKSEKDLIPKIPPLLHIMIMFGFRMWEILILKWFLPLKIQINSKKPVFGKKNELRMW